MQSWYFGWESGRVLIRFLSFVGLDTDVPRLGMHGGELRSQRVGAGTWGWLGTGFVEWEWEV